MRRDSSPYTIQNLKVRGILKEIEYCRLLCLISQPLQCKKVIAFPNAFKK